jgi:hypothetical protein
MPRKKSSTRVNYKSNTDDNRDGRTTRSEAAAANVDVSNPADLNDDVSIYLLTRFFSFFSSWNS